MFDVRPSGKTPDSVQVGLIETETASSQATLVGVIVRERLPEAAVLLKLKAV